MRARPREPQEGASTSMRPSDDAMWRMFFGQCMDRACPHEAETWITTQLRWNSLPVAWCFCAGHALAWIRLFVGCHMYFLQIEAAGTFQPALPLD